MTRKETKAMEIHNFFSDKIELLECEFELHLDSKHKLDGIYLRSVMSKGQIEIISRLTDDEVDSVEQAFSDYMKNE